MLDVQGSLAGTYHINLGLGDVGDFSGMSLALGDLSVSDNTQTHTVYSRHANLCRTRPNESHDGSETAQE